MLVQNRSIIKIKNMSFTNNNKRIFNDFDLEIKQNSFVSIIGLNASSKSTLSKILIGTYNASGYINIDGYLLNDNFINKIRRIFSSYYEDYDLSFEEELVKDILSFPLENLDYSKREIESSIKNISKKFKIEDILNKSFIEIDDSEKEKVIIASLLINKPKILLLDNKLYNLNSSDKKLIFKLLLEYKRKENLTIILITNNLEDTLYSDRIIVLDKGNILLDNTKEEIYKDDKLEKLGFNLPFIVKLSHNLILYNLLDKTYFKESEVINKLWN